MKHIATYTNVNLGLRAVVSQREDKSYAMQLQDVDGDFIVGVYTTRIYENKQQALAAAMAAVSDEDL